MTDNYEVELMTGEKHYLVADFVDVLDGESGCVRFARKTDDGGAVVIAVLFRVKAVLMDDSAKAGVERSKRTKK